MVKRPITPWPTPVALRDYEPQPGDIPVLFEGQAEGAIPNGTAIVKVWSEPGDYNPTGTRGVVLASHRAGDMIGYFVKWETLPDRPVFVADKKIAVSANTGEEAIAFIKSQKP